MKVLFGALVSAFVFVGAATAQTETTTTPPPAPVAPSSCAVVPPAPTLPDGATATREQMEAGNTAYRTWYEAAAAAVACRHQEALAIRAVAEARTAEHNTAVEGLNAVSTSWTAEAAEFNARGGNRR